MRHLAPFLVLALSLSTPRERVLAQGAMLPAEVFATLPTSVTKVRSTLNGQRLYYLVGDMPGSNAPAQLWMYDVPTRRSTRLSEGQMQSMTVSPTGDRIAFARSSEDRATTHIWTIPLDPTTGLAAGVARRTSVGSGNLPMVSPDGKLIAYRGSANYVRRLSVIPVNGGIERILLDGRALLEPAGWSADGKWIYFVAGMNYDDPFLLQRVSTVDGTLQTILAGVSYEAMVSPDGARLSVSMPSSAYYALVDTNGTVLTTRFADPGAGGDGWLTATRLLMVQQEHPVALKSLSLSTGTVKEVLSPAHRVVDALWAPDGKRFAAVSIFPGDSARIVIASADGTNLRTIRLADRPGYGWSWSPDGQWIAIINAGGLTGAIAVEAATGRTIRLGTLSGGELTRLRWMPDSRHLRYVHATRNDSTPRGLRQLVREVDLNGVDALVRVVDGPGYIGFASDSTIFFNRDNVTYVQSLTSGRITRLYDGRGMNMTLSPKGDMVAIRKYETRDGPGVDVVTTGGTPVIRLPFPGDLGTGFISGLRFTPDGRYLITSGGKADGGCCSLYLAPLDGKPVRTLLDIPHFHTTPVVALSPDGDTVLVSSTPGFQTILGAIDISGVTRSHQKR